MPDFLNIYRVKITPLTPVHVGSGETIEPFEYLLRGDELWVLSPQRLLELLQGEDLENYLKALERGPFAAREALAKIASATDLRPAITWRAPVGRAFARYLEEAFEKRTGELAVRVFPRSLKGPYLPGSSLKGAIRTVLLFDLSREELKAEFDEESYQWRGERDLVWVSGGRHLYPGDWRLQSGLGRIRPPIAVKDPRGWQKRDVYRINVRFESHLLRNPPRKKGDADVLRDPLRALAVADSGTLPKTELRLIEVYGSKREKSSPTGIRLLAETWVQGSVESELRFHWGLQTKKSSLLLRGRGSDKAPPLLKLDDLAASAYERYINLAEEELAFYEDRGWNLAKRRMEAVLEAIESCLNEDGTMKKPYRFPLRLGFGASELTMRLSEFIEYNGRGGGVRIDPVSRKLAEGEPMGWVMVEVLG